MHLYKYMLHMCVCIYTNIGVCYVYVCIVAYKYKYRDVYVVYRLYKINIRKERDLYRQISISEEICNNACQTHLDIVATETHKDPLELGVSP